MFKVQRAKIKVGKNSVLGQTTRGLGFCRQRKLCVQKQEDVRHGGEECEEELGNETE